MKTSEKDKRGGRREGAGRPKGTTKPNKKVFTALKVPQDLLDWMRAKRVEEIRQILYAAKEKEEEKAG